jgi:hypothetical protein
MRRRAFITLLGGAAAAWPMAGRAQQDGRVRRVGVLMTTAADDPEGQARLAAFVQGLQQLGWIDGRNARIDTYWAAGTSDATLHWGPSYVSSNLDVWNAIRHGGNPPEASVTLKRSGASASLSAGDSSVIVIPAGSCRVRQ